MSDNPKKSPKRQAPQPTGPPLNAPTASPSKAPLPVPSDPKQKDLSTTPKTENKGDANANPQLKLAEEEESHGETGGLSAFRKADQLISRVLSKVEDEIKIKINELRKDERPIKANAKLEIIGYRTIVVAGFIYFAKIKISGESFIQARILENTKGDISLQSVTETKTLADEEEYFKLPKAKAHSAAKADSAPKNDKGNISNKEDLESEFQTGGLSTFKKVDHVIERVVSKVEDEIRAKINELKKEGPPLENSTNLEIVGYRSNVVAGFIYFAKIKIPGESFIQARILETLRGDISLQSVTETKTDADEKEYFKLP